MTLYAHTTDGTTDGTIDQIGSLPALWLGPTRWHDWRGDPATWATQPADWGWQPVVETPRPADTETTTSDPAPVALVDGVPTQQWTVRPWTADELAARAAAANAATLTGTAKLAQRLTRLAAYKTDAEIVAALARNNSTAIPTADLNRLLKVMLRRDERQSATIALLVRLSDPALLADVADTIDA